MESPKSIPAAYEQKRTRMETDDRISNLPDDILVSIVCRLSLAEAASSCVLSKRWKYLWRYHKVFDFVLPNKIMALEKLLDSGKGERGSYVNWVNRVVQLHQGSKITDFKVNFFLGKHNSFDIDEWFNFAIRKSVERLEVNLLGSSFLGYYHSARCYTFPDKVFSLIKTPFGLSSIKSLTQVCFKCVNVTGEVVEHLLSNCPLLQKLCVSFTTLLVNLKIKKRSPPLCLKILEISHCARLQNAEIYAPNLESFICLLMVKESRIRVKHAPSLVHATVGHNCGFRKALHTIFPCFSRLESLTMPINPYMEMYNSGHIPQLTNLKNLTLQMQVLEEYSFLFSTPLIERSPVLRKLTLQLGFSRKIRRSVGKIAKRPHKCLEVVEFVGNIDFEVVMYFVQNSVAPQKKIIVDCRLPIFTLERVKEMKEDDREELRKLALELRNKLPSGVDLVCN